MAVPDQRGYGTSETPQDIEAYNIREFASDVAGIAAALGEENFIVVGHAWGAMVAWHTALLHEDTCKSVMALSIPYRRSQNPDTTINPPGMDGRFWYIRYFQEPGIAEASLEADVRRTLRTCYHALSGDAPAGTWMAQLQHPADATLLDVLPVPAALPSWLTENTFDYYVQFYERCGFRGPINWYRNIGRMNAVTPELDNKQVAPPDIMSGRPTGRISAITGCWTRQRYC